MTPEIPSTRSRSPFDPRRNERGGVAIEYLLVSIFALMVTLASMAGVRSMVLSKLEEVDSEHSINTSAFKLDMFSSGS